MASRLSRILPFLFITLLCIGAVEGGYSIVEYFLFRQPAEKTVPSGTQTAKEGPAPSGAKRDYQIILTRNLFGSQKTAESSAPAPKVDVAALDKSDLEVVLVGTVDGTAGTHRAIIYDKKTRKQDIYKEGDQVKGARLKEILRGKAVLDVEGKEELLDMSEAASVRPPAQGGAPDQQPRQIPPQPVRPRGLVQPPTRIQVPAPAAAELAPGGEAAPTAEAGPEAVPPEPQVNGSDASPAGDGGPDASEAVQEAAPAEAPPPASEARIVRPRVIRPYRSQ